MAAKVSHVPALLSAALVGEVMPGGKADPATGRLASTGFRDASRLAASDPTLMADILLTNMDTIGESLVTIRSELDTLVGLVEADDAAALRARLEAIQQARIAWAEEHGFAT